MKTKLLSIFTVILITGNYCAQIISDNFDSYTAGDGISAVSTDFNTWNGMSDPAEDAYVSTDYAFSGANSLKVSTATGTDAVLLLGDHTSGVYEVAFKMNVPPGEGGYFNMMHQWTIAGDYQWAFDIYFSSAGEITYRVAGVPDIPSTVSFINGTWFDVSVIVDLDADLARIQIDGQTVTNFQWSLNAGDGAPGLNELSVVDFFGTAPAGSGDGLYYIDDLTFNTSTIDLSGISDEEIANPVAVYPNPTSDVINISVVNSGIVSTNIYNELGALVYSTTINSGQISIPVTNFTSGVYFVEVINGANRSTQRVVVK